MRTRPHPSLRSAQVARLGDAVVGESVTRKGSTTGVHTGRLTALDVSVRHQGGGSGDCRTGGTTLFQPVREAASAYGVSIY